ncbi:gamma-glutamyltransferase [Conexibacter woesei]|uniref:gamma-glutamyltransferase n=1 Tax=Conexibacter woesei TaxID=191495 RepID=UPI00041E1BDF|nr:gamma-glutamyltransferase [Conexibacter woesei]
MTSSVAIATPHRTATAVGRRVMEEGGSAVDGALAAAAVLTVVYPHNCALGGDLMALVRDADGVTRAVNATGPAAGLVDVDGLRARHGGVLPVAGIDTVTVPGLVAGWGELYALGGVLPWASLLADAERLAREGFVPTAKLLTAIDEAPAPVLVPDGDGVLRQAALAETFAILRAEGARALYEGPLAARFAAGLEALGSAIRVGDLASFRPSVEEPLRVGFRGVDVLSAGPNCSGVLLLQALAALEAAALDDPLGADAGALAAIFAAGWRQREASLADPRFAPQDLDAWLGQEAISRVATERVLGVEGTRPRPTGDTIALVTRDGEGRAVSLIQSLYWSFGSQLIEPSTGIILQNRGTSFSLDPDHPNVLAPGKRPAHTLMPVMVERDGTLAGVLGTMGGKAQPQIHTQILLRLLAGATPQEAISAPRFTIADTTLTLESDLNPAAATSLHATGTPVIELTPHDEELGHAHAIWGTTSGTDPRADGLPGAG